MARKKNTITANSASPNCLILRYSPKVIIQIKRLNSYKFLCLFHLVPFRSIEHLLIIPQQPVWVICMKLLNVGMVFMLLLSIAAVGFAAHDGQGDNNGPEPDLFEVDDNDSLENETDEEELEDETDEEEEEKEEAETEEEELEAEDETGGPGPGGKGIAEQVHQLIQEKKNGTLEVPMGQMVRIVAQNREVSAGNETIPLTEQLRVKVKIKNKTHVVGFNSTEEEEIEIEEENVSVDTEEDVTISGDEMFIGKNKTKVLIMPAAVPGKAFLKEMKSAVLHVVNDTPVYDVNGTRGAKVLWVFDVEMPVQARVHAQNGNIMREGKPWWSVLVTSEETEEGEEE